MRFFQLSLALSEPAVPFRSRAPLSLPPPKKNEKQKNARAVVQAPHRRGYHPPDPLPGPFSSLGLYRSRGLDERQRGRRRRGGREPAPARPLRGRPPARLGREARRAGHAGLRGRQGRGGAQEGGDARERRERPGAARSVAALGPVGVPADALGGLVTGGPLDARRGRAPHGAAQGKAVVVPPGRHDGPQVSSKKDIFLSLLGSFFFSFSPMKV